MTTITGYLYNAQGSTLTTGHLRMTLQQDIVVSGQKVAPSTVTANLAANSGYVSVNVYPTATATPSGVAYFVEFDPDPTDTTKPINAKTGYWFNYWNVPDTPTTTLGSFAPALRGATSANYLPVGSPAVGIAPAIEIITSGNKTLTAAETGKVVIIDSSTARTVTLPTPSAGLRFVVTTKQVSGSFHKIAVGSGITIYGWATSKTNSYFSQSGSGAAGDSVEIVGYNATTYYIINSRGAAWT